MQVDIYEGQVVLTDVKLTLVMSKTEFIAALQRGKAYRRQQARQARVMPMESHDR
jgi:hypothetical protein